MRLASRIFSSAVSLAIAAAGVVVGPALSAQAAQPLGALTIVTTTINPTTTSFPFTFSRASSTGQTGVTIVGASSVTLPFVATSVLKVTEVVPASFGPVTISCQLNGAATGVVSGSSIGAVRISPNKTTTCTFAQTALPVTVAATLSFSPTVLPHLGGDTQESWSVKNTSAFPVKITALNDSRMGALSVPSCTVGTTLAAGATCGGSLSLWLSQPSGGTATSTFTASVVSAAGASASSTRSGVLTFLLPNPQLNVTMVANPATLPRAGGWATVTVQATNATSGTVTLGDFYDTNLGPMDFSATCHAGTVLPSGASCSFQSTWWFSSPTGAALTSTVWNLATLNGNPVLGEGTFTVTFS